jgi:hypothetical protein
MYALVAIHTRNFEAGEESNLLSAQCMAEIHATDNPSWLGIKPSFHERTDTVWMTTHEALWALLVFPGLAGETKFRQYLARDLKTFRMKNNTTSRALC